jgi:hypothetical protein
MSPWCNRGGKNVYEPPEESQKCKARGHDDCPILLQPRQGNASAFPKRHKLGTTITQSYQLPAHHSSHDILFPLVENLAPSQSWTPSLKWVLSLSWLHPSLETHPSQPFVPGGNTPSLEEVVWATSSTCPAQPEVTSAFISQMLHTYLCFHFTFKASLFSNFHVLAKIGHVSEYHGLSGTGLIVMCVSSSLVFAIRLCAIAYYAHSAI